MRRHDRRRGAKVTGDADLEGVSPEMVFSERAGGVNGPAGHSDVHTLASERHPSRDLRPRRALQRECAVTKESRSSAHRTCALPDKRNSEGGSGVDRQSEAPVRAVKSGNADGAKGRRSGRTDQGDMTRHRADCVHDN
jgi:hypothetical protein